MISVNHGNGSEYSSRLARRQCPNVTFIPAMPIGVRGEVAGVLFFIEGETIYGWYAADQAEQVWDSVPVIFPTENLVFPPMQQEAPEPGQKAGGWWKSFITRAANCPDCRIVIATPPRSVKMRRGSSSMTGSHGLTRADVRRILLPK
ncbi:MAG: hypothetical protein HY318_08605 [Armatimonadetes bacterium]|nr:hypothetical protein [Armatimonadota bacterium]